MSEEAQEESCVEKHNYPTVLGIAKRTPKTVVNTTSQRPPTSEASRAVPTEDTTNITRAGVPVKPMNKDLTGDEYQRIRARVFGSTSDHEVTSSTVPPPPVIPSPLGLGTVPQTQTKTRGRLSFDNPEDRQEYSRNDGSWKGRMSVPTPAGLTYNNQRGAWPQTQASSFTPNPHAREFHPTMTTLPPAPMPWLLPGAPPPGWNGMSMPPGVLPPMPLRNPDGTPMMLAPSPPMMISPPPPPGTYTMNPMPLAPQTLQQGAPPPSYMFYPTGNAPPVPAVPNRIHPRE